MKLLVTGGAGYIGSYTVKLLKAAGHDVVVLDNLSNGHREAIPDVTLEVADIRDFAALEAVFAKYQFDAVLHFAALIDVPESVANPAEYFDVNLAGSLQLFKTMVNHGVKQCIFSSTAAVYGTPETNPIDENAPTNPANPYGLSKLQVEQVLKTFDPAYNLKFVVLRYFNVAGADPDGQLGDAHKKKGHLIAAALEHARGVLPDMQVFGTDYPTRDGSGVRDFIHLHDLAQAHVLALDYLAKGGSSQTFNLGNSHGFSVREVLATVEEVTDKKLTIIEAPRRPGDCAEVVASNDKAKLMLGWQPAYPKLQSMVKGAWDWLLAHPNGYDNDKSN